MYSGVIVMTERLNNIKVYHGSYTEVKIPDLNKCRSGKISLGR